MRDVIKANGVSGSYGSFGIGAWGLGIENRGIGAWSLELEAWGL